MTEISKDVLPADWDERIDQLGGNVLQGRAWALFQEALGRDVFCVGSDGWAWSAARRQSRGGFKYLFVGYGPVARDAAALAEALSSLREVATEQKVDFVRFEPVGDFDESMMIQAGARQTAEINPQHTSVLDLTKTEDELKSGLESGHRNRINGAARRGISIQKSAGNKPNDNDPNDINDFLRMMADTARRSDIIAYDDDYYRTLLHTMGESGAAQLYYAVVDSQRIAGAIVFDWQSTRYYAYAAADQERNRQVGASVVLVWQTIMDAKAAGKTRYDFWGVADSTASSEHPWAGLSAFKRGFGGVDKSYHGTWDLPIRPLAYQIYRAAKRLTP